MPDSNGKQNPVDIAHRLGIWMAVLGLAAYLFNIGAWVGAADEKFEDADTVEKKQDALIIQVTTLATQAKATTTAVESNTTAIQTSKQEILDAMQEPIGAASLKSLRKRTRATMGRCQGFNCAPKVNGLLAEHNGQDIMSLVS